MEILERRWTYKYTKIADSFTAKLRKRKPLIFLEKVGGLWFLASKKQAHGTTMGLARLFGAFFTGNMGQFVSS